MVRPSSISLLALCLLCPTGFAQAQSASEFEKLRARLLAGIPAVAVVDFSRCKQQSAGADEKAKPIGGFQIQDFLIKPAPNPHIAFADEHFTVLPDGTPVLEVIQYRIMPNEAATITVRRLSPAGYQQLSAPFMFACPLGTGLRFKPEAGKISVR